MLAGPLCTQRTQLNIILSCGVRRLPDLTSSVQLRLDLLKKFFLNLSYSYNRYLSKRSTAAYTERWPTTVIDSRLFDVYAHKSNQKKKKVQ